ncbi:unnamed protein product [Brassica napus]|uniref:(rape) hypothetical protein n=1 Tax=Brassica napus TaxID=3708 RepID=A0A816TNY8_BRANA|nr:unnamed protein product [Brassica napus]
MCNVEEPPLEPWVPMRPFSERVVGRPSRCTLPFLGTVRSFCPDPENVDFRLPLEGERADEPPEGFFTLYEEHLMRARLWFPIPSVIVEFLDRLEVSISQISPRGIKHFVGLLVLGYERGMELTADYLEAFLTLSRVGTDRLYGFRSRTHMEVLKGFSHGGCGWKSYFFYVRLDQASYTTPIPLFPEDLCIVRDLLRGGPLFWGHFFPERVRTAVEAHRSRSSLSIDNDMGASFEDTSLPAVYATGQSSGRGSCFREVVIGWTDPLWPYLYLPGLAVSGFESLTALRGFIYMMGISCLEMFETRALGLGQDLGLLSVKVCAVTSRLSFFLLRFLPDSYRFKVRNRFSAYMTCMVRIEYLLIVNWKC